MVRFVRSLEQTKSWVIYELVIEVMIDDLGNHWLIDAYDFN